MRLCIVSGGQTGADRAALDVALILGLPIDGWCPRGRWAEDGAIPSRYPLRETAGEDPGERTRANVRDSDATLVLTLGAPDMGTDLTIAAAATWAKPCTVIDLTVPGIEAVARDWLRRVQPRRLNVAGPRESSAPGLCGRAHALLLNVLRDVGVDDDLDEPIAR